MEHTYRYNAAGELSVELEQLTGSPAATLTYQYDYRPER